MSNTLGPVKKWRRGYPAEPVPTGRQGSMAASFMPWMIFLSAGQNVASVPGESAMQTPSRTK